MEIAQEFNALLAEERRLWAKLDDLEVDLKIAQRLDKPEVIKAAEEAWNAGRNVWHEAYEKAKASASALAKALGVDPIQFARML